jgi:LPXTG-site transpeptidase (sortase) family protein
MYSRRRRTNPIGCLLAGAVILIGAIAAFTLFQSQSSTKQEPTASKPAVTPIQQKTAVPTPQSTVAANTLKIFSAKARIAAEITEVRYGKAENWDVAYLGKYAGHLEGTNKLSQGGNYVLAGHVELKDGSEGAFAHIDQLQIGDSISLMRTDAGQLSVLPYTVTEIKSVAPDDISAIRNHGYDELTLLTCHDWDQKTSKYRNRIIIHARPLSQPKAQVNLVPPPK